MEADGEGADSYDDADGGDDCCDHSSLKNSRTVIAAAPIQAMMLMTMAAVKIMAPSGPNGRGRPPRVRSSADARQFRRTGGSAKTALASWHAQRGRGRRAGACRFLRRMPRWPSCRAEATRT